MRVQVLQQSLSDLVNTAFLLAMLRKGSIRKADEPASALSTFAEIPPQQNARGIVSPASKVESGPEGTWVRSLAGFTCSMA